MNVFVPVLLMCLGTDVNNCTMMQFESHFQTEASCMKVVREKLQDKMAPGTELFISCLKIKTGTPT